MNRKKILIIIAAVTVVFILITAKMLLTGPRMRNQASIRTFEAEMPVLPDDVIPYHDDNEEAGYNTFDEVYSVAEMIDMGGVYYGYYCVFCHGDDGKGNGPVGESYTPKPADLASDTIREYTEEELYYASFYGTGHEPVLERVVPMKHRKSILLYIQNEFMDE